MNRRDKLFIDEEYFLRKAIEQISMINAKYFQKIFFIPMRKVSEV